LGRADCFFTRRASTSSFANAGFETNGLSRRQVLVGATAVALTGCGGGSGSSGAPSANSPTPAPSPAPPVQVVGPEVLTVSQFYQPEHGLNLQPAFQTAINAAAAKQVKIVNDYGAISGEMWCPVRTMPASAGHVADGMYLVINHSIHLDFRGAKFDLKGPGGASRDQPFEGYESPWRGGWLMSPSGAGYDRLTVENVVVDGGFTGSYQTPHDRNLTDKGVWLGDTRIREVFMHNVELRNFAGEIYYAVGLGPDYQYVENCHFHGSPQCAWDPATVGRVVAVNLRAGRAYQCAEVLGGRESIYEGGLFYDSGEGGSVFYGGPSPDFNHGTYPWWYPLWDGIAPKPVVEFRGTRFERVKFVRLSAFARGNLEATDGVVWLDASTGDVRDVELKVKHWTDRMNGSHALMFGGPANLTSQVPGARDGVFIQPPHHIKVEVECSLTANAVSAGYRLTSGFRFNGGLVDVQSVSINVAGHARQAWDTGATAPPNSIPPAVTADGFVG
jgi:hypothetical protein